jgi:N-acetylneuraminic acid mutarotase
MNYRFTKMRKNIALFLFFSASLSGLSSAQEGNWKVVKTVNTGQNCNECGMAAINGKLYLIGNDGENPVPVKSLDPNSLTWTSLAESPVIMHHFQPIGYKGKIYVLEAFSEGKFPDQAPMPNVYSYDTQTNTWEKGGEMPAERRRAAAGAAEYKGKLYLVAGIKHGHSSGTNNLFDCYDPDTKTWTSLPDAPHIRDHCFASVVKDKLYVVGGRNTSYRDPENKIPFFAKTVLDVDVFDFITGKWSTLPARLPLGSGGGNLVNLNNVLYYMGGERATETERNAPRKNTYFLDPSSSDKWTETDSLHYARNGMAATVLNNKIYAAGGSGGGPGGPPPNGQPLTQQGNTSIPGLSP